MHSNGHTARGQCSFKCSCLVCTEMFKLLLCVFSSLVTQLEGKWGAEGSAKEHSPPRPAALQWHDETSQACFSCRLFGSPDKTLTRGTGWSLLKLTSSWALPSPVTCDKQQPTENRLSPSATQTTHWNPRRRLVDVCFFFCVRWALNLTLMAPDKCSYWL